MDEIHADDRGLIELDVLGIRVLGNEDSPILLLNESGGTTLLPIWIGHVEAAAIALQMTGNTEIDRPLTHDLLATMIQEFVGDGVGQVIITHVDEGRFFARILVQDLDFDARPSDAVTLALKLQWPIRCPRTLMDQVGVEVDELPIDEVDEFRAFLDSVNADDFSEEENG